MKKIIYFSITSLITIVFLNACSGGSSSSGNIDTVTSDLNGGKDIGAVSTNTKPTVSPKPESDSSDPVENDSSDSIESDPVDLKDPIEGDSSNDIENDIVESNSMAGTKHDNGSKEL